MRQRPGIICLALALITLGLYAPVLRNSFVNFDDQAYVTDNPHVEAGLTTSGVAWAFSSAGYASNWHPLTWISHMLDCQFFGLNPAGHHAINVIFHAVNTVLLFLLLLRMTGALWRSALVAALFAWHPLHVESVAWVSERKDVLSAFFCLLALLAYVAYAKKFKVQGPRSKVFYGMALALFACGLMSKPMLVTLPIVMLLLDFWPLRRIADPRFAIGDLKSDENSVIEKVSLKRALLEKAPFLALALISSVLTIVAQHAGGSVASLSRLPILTRVSMALVSYGRYIVKTVWPENLSAYYPPVAGWPSWMILTSAIFLAAVSVYCWRARRTEPYLVIGWTWFLVMLVPVIGLVQVGTQAMADRYTYLPAIGLFIIAAWELERLSRKAPQMKMALTAASGVALAVCLFLSRERVFDWRNSGTLFEQSLRVAPGNNFMAHALLGSYLNDQGRFVDAEPHFVEALKVAPTFPIAQYGMGNSLLAQQKWTNAAEHFSRAIEYSPGYAEAHFGRGTTYLVRGNSEMALADFEEAVRLKPNWPAALNNLAWILATATDAKYRNGARAVHLAERACKLAGNRQPLYLGTLAAAYAEAGQFKEAIATGEKASELALAAGEKSVSEKNLQLLELYRANKPYHEPPPQPATPQN